MGHLTLFEAYRFAKEACGETEARILCEVFLKRDHGYILAHKEESADADALRRAVAERQTGKPLQYILGEWEFYGRRFLVGEGVLIPRQDTETLCETVLGMLPQNAVLLDLCTGSGCIPITLSAERQDLTVYALEKMPSAYTWLMRNIALHQSAVQPILDDALKPTCLCDLPQFDLITANPPYLTDADMDALQTEVRFEPETALYGDQDGLLFYRELTRIWKEKLKSGGKLVYEIGIHQETAVADILRENGFSDICFVRDLCGIIRVVYGSLNDV